MNRTLFLAVLLGCSPVKKRPANNWSEQYCNSKVEMVFPNDQWAEYDGCQDLTVDAHYEFDPDDPPEVLDYKIQLNGLADPNVECWLIVTAHGVCGPGYYGVGEGQSATVEFATFDCPYVPDEFEGNYSAETGTIYLEKTAAGDRAGDFTDQPLLTEIQGRLDASTPEGILVTVTWDLGVLIESEDGEESDCLQMD